jgi:protocatechuate 3,4-dioxygenase beta subunit
VRFGARTVAALAVAVFSGHVIDKTTGQPLAGVRVAIGTARATTDKAGRFALHGVRSGNATITLESSDVPLQRVTVTITAPATAHDVPACSTTLDYNCGAPAAPAGAS